ncbi:putative toxin-antitoxin system toxin component, PIN family [Variovorax rhizosphaerae]|uniref:Toxin-antitoxin system toxin component, PIN family n=1 Tax=Variovorax rhizosphaerae TaxID=1836200 RepID=A0ABU8WUB7_9BURK
MLDTNVVVSALLWGGPPRHLRNLALDGQIVLVSSPVLLAELHRILNYPRLTQRLVQLDTSVAELVTQYQAIVTMVHPFDVPRVVPNDVDDDHVVAAAVAGQVELIVSGDRDLLQMQSHAGIAILNPRDAWERIAAQR